VSEPTERIVPVVIMGQRYPIKSALDPTYVVELAAYVDEKMRTAAETGASHDSLRLAVLAALNIADEIYRCRHASELRARTVDERARALEQVLDAVLASAES
jgi:cell division protein ZapA